MSVVLLGLSGYARSGKDTAASLLPEFQRIAVADVLRDFLYALNPLVASFRMDSADIRVQDIIDEYGWAGYKNTIYAPEIRELLQRLGTEAGRHLMGEDIWINATLDNLPPGKYAVTDVRFPNEAEAIRNRGGKMIRIIRPGIEPVNSHFSEVALDNYDFDATVINSGSKELFQRRLDHVIKNLFDHTS